MLRLEPDVSSFLHDRGVLRHATLAAYHRRPLVHGRVRHGLREYGTRVQNAYRLRRLEHRFLCVGSVFYLLIFFDMSAVSPFSSSLSFLSLSPFSLALPLSLSLSPLPPPPPSLSPALSLPLPLSHTGH